jgi:hypothetical protein
MKKTTQKVHNGEGRQVGEGCPSEDGGGNQARRQEGCPRDWYGVNA